MSTPPPPALPRILVVEDAPFLRYAFSRLLRLHGYEVAEATNGAEALIRFADFRPDVVLTDLMMPVMSGLELIRVLRSHADAAAVPIMAITADDSSRTRDMARDAGVDDFVVKPVDLPELIDRLNRCLSERNTGSAVTPG